MWEEAWFSISIREIFHQKNWIGYSRNINASKITRYTVLMVCVWVQVIVHTVRVENFEVVLISRFSWVADDTKIIHVEGRINTREIF